MRAPPASWALPPASWALGALVLTLLAPNAALDSEAESAYPITHEKQPVGAYQPTPRTTTTPTFVPCLENVLAFPLPSKTF